MHVTLSSSLSLLLSFSVNSKTVCLHLIEMRWKIRDGCYQNTSLLQNLKQTFPAPLSRCLKPSECKHHHLESLSKVEKEVR